MDNVIISILLVVVGLFVGAFIMMIINKFKVSAAQKEADKLIQDAKKEAEKVTETKENIIITDKVREINFFDILFAPFYVDELIIAYYP